MTMFDTSLLPEQPGPTVELIPSLTRWEALKRTAVAFSNQAAGGTIWIGVRSGGDVPGIDAALHRYGSTDRIRNAIYSAIRDGVEPPSVDMDVDLFTVAGRTVVRIKVYGGVQIPYRVRQVYVRDGDLTRLASDKECEALVRQRQRWARIHRWRRLLLSWIAWLIVFLGLVLSYLVGSPAIVALLTRPQQIALDPEGMIMTGPALSPDGKMALVTLYPDGETDRRDIFAISPGASDWINLTDHPALDSDPQFSPDGRWIVFCSDREEPGIPQLHMMSVEGRGVRRLAEYPGHCKNPVYSPDATRIAFDAPDEGGARQVFIVATDGTGLRQVTRGPHRHEHPGFSPDGQWLAYSSERDNNWDIYLLNLESGEERRLTQHPASDYAPSFIGNEGWVLFESTRAIWRGLYLAALDDDEVISLTWHLVDEAAVSADGQWIVLEADSGPRQGVYRMSYRSPRLFKTWQYQGIVHLHR